MKKWSIPVMVAIVALLMPASSATASAQEKDSFCIDKTFDRWAVHLTNTIARTDNAASDNVTMTKSEILKLKGVIGKGINTAPGLQKPFNLKSQAAKHTVNSDNVTLTKAEILKLMGVPGKGIETAPGLQKPFNPKSQAAEHAGKKDNDSEEEQLRIMQSTENHGDTQGQIEIKQKLKNQR